MNQPTPNQFSWSTEVAPPGRRLDMWREMFARTFIECDIDSLDGDAFWASIRYDRYGQIGVGSLAASRERYTTTRDQAKRNPDGYILDLVWNGSFRYEQSGRDEVLKPGDGVFFHNCVPGTMTAMEPAETRSIYIPAQFLEHVFGDTGALVGRILRYGQPESRLLTAYLQAVHQTAGLHDPGTRELIGQQVVDLVVTAVGRSHREAMERAERGLRSARLKLAKDEIARRLSEPMLNGDRVASKLGVSERYLQKLFEESGTTISQYIAGERLRQIRAALSDPSQDHRLIADIAYDMGFSDVTQFNRAFKRRYGYTPSAARETAPERPAR